MVIPGLGQVVAGTPWPVLVAWLLHFTAALQSMSLATEYTAYSSSYWVDDVMWYDCYNTGTWTYRVIVTGYAAGGAYSKTVQSANYLRTTC
jgi:hypothetical protein